MRCSLLLLAIVAFVGVAAQNTFCEQYTGAIFGNATDPVSQKTLVNLVVTRAFTGGVGMGVTVLGLYNEPNNAPYFNGTKYPNINYLAGTAATNMSLTTLVDHLDRFFMFALGCRAGAASNPWTPVSLYSVHAAMGINKVTTGAFITQVATSLVSFGVSGSTSLPTDPLVSIVALMSQFNRYTSMTPPSSSICIDSTCDLANGIGQIEVSTATGAFNVIMGTGQGTTGLTLNQGDYVTFLLPLTQTIQQTSSATDTTPLSGGISTTAGNRFYTTQMNTPGTFYFYNSATGMSAMRATVTVLGLSSSGSSMMGSSTGGSMMGSTGSMMGSTGSMMASTGSSTKTSTGVNAAVSTASAAAALVITMAAAVIAVVA